jgi:HKD family nuclease
MFYSQPFATRFGTDLITHIESGEWLIFDFAVAWVRASGIAHLEHSLISFLNKGNQLNVTVGIDLDNTTQEGLDALLKLQINGRMTIFVHHNEAGTIFHPKLYLFRNRTDAALIVGSNNLTEAGLFKNTEAGLEIRAGINDEIVTSALNSIEAWRDTKSGLAKELTPAFLIELVENGYVKSEVVLRSEIAARNAASKPKGAGLIKLFKSLSITAPIRKSFTSISNGTGVKTKSSTLSKTTTPLKTVSKASATGQVLLMRVRKSRGTQVQIPLAVMRTPFFTGATQVQSVSSNVTRGIHATHAARSKAGSAPNTLKLELPETSSMKDPVVRFERNAAGVQYEVYDSSSNKGKIIMKALQVGRTMNPPTTKFTVPSSPSTSTWWRFI